MIAQHRRATNQCYLFVRQAIQWRVSSAGSSLLEPSILPSEVASRLCELLTFTGRSQLRLASEFYLRELAGEGDSATTTTTTATINPTTAHGNDSGVCAASLSVGVSTAGSVFAVNAVVVLRELPLERQDDVVPGTKRQTHRKPLK